MQTTTSTRDIVAPTATLGDLQAIMADLSRAHPDAGARVQHGAFLALMGHAEASGPGAWWVTSERDGTTQYFVLPQYGTCTCQDFQRHGHLSPCKHRLCVEVLARLERLEVDRAPTLAVTSPPAPADLLDAQDGTPIPYRLTTEALAMLDDYRQRDAARCPECHEFKFHGSLYCEGEQCAVTTRRLESILA